MLKMVCEEHYGRCCNLKTEEFVEDTVQTGCKIAEKLEVNSLIVVHLFARFLINISI